VVAMIVIKKGILKGKRSEFMEHYFKMYSLCEQGNEAIFERCEKYSSVNDFLRRSYSIANIPTKYFDFEFDQIKDKILTVEDNVQSVATLEKYLNNLGKAVQKGIGIYLSGPHGVAKTTISIIILKQAIKLDFKCFFCKSSEIVDFVRSGWRSEEKKTFWNYVTNSVDFLVIDDIARLFQFEMTEPERVYIDQIFTKRDDLNLPTILTANHILRENQDLFGEALFSNFKERLIEVKLLGEDYRFSIGNNLEKQLE
jgi:DNA replication protein DnaC